MKRARSRGCGCAVVAGVFHRTQRAVGNNWRQTLVEVGEGKHSLGTGKSAVATLGKHHKRSCSPEAYSRRARGRERTGLIRRQRITGQPRAAIDAGAHPARLVGPGRRRGGLLPISPVAVDAALIGMNIP